MSDDDNKYGTGAPSSPPARSDVPRTGEEPGVFGQLTVDLDTIDSNVTEAEIERVVECVVQKAQTAGDQSPAAVGEGEPFSIEYVPWTTPGGRKEASDSWDQTLPHGILEPPDDPVQMYRLYRLSAYLQPLISAWLTNVYRPKWKLEPVLDPDKPEGREKLKRALVWERAQAGSFQEVPKEEIDKLAEEFKQRAMLESAVLERFFEEAIPDMSYEDFRIYHGQDKKITGNVYWEVLRDSRGRISRLKWLPSVSMRCTREIDQYVACTKWAWDPGLKWIKSPQLRRFRRYAQVDGTQVLTWFKEFGDERVMSRLSGNFFSSLAALQAAEGPKDPNSEPVPLAATEIIHIRSLYGGDPAYGKSDYSGVAISMLGSRELDEENLKVVSDDEVPSLILLVSGGIVAKDVAKRIQHQIKDRPKGRKGIIVIQAQSAARGPQAHSANPVMQIERTKAQQTGDALFQKYDERNELKIGTADRMPKALIGRDLGQNRATTLAMMRFAEEQLFDPERADFDKPINNPILPELGITCWRYRTCAMEPIDPQILMTIVKAATESGLLAPNEARPLISRIFNRELKSLTGLWAQLPPRVLTVLLQSKNTALASLLLSDDPDDMMKLSEAVKMMEAEEGIDDRQGRQAATEESGEGPGQRASGDRGEGT